jgi:hypothetical protein
MAKKEKVKVEGEVREFVDKAEFERFRNEQEKIQNKMLALLEKSVEPATTVSPVVKGEAPSGAATTDFNNDYLPPQYRQVFEKYFDPKDGFTARLIFPEIDDKGNERGGITFTIFVPLELSNTDDGYRKMYKQDLRSRALQPHSIAKGIEEYCKAVAKNLHYNKDLKRK